MLTLWRQFTLGWMSYSNSLFVLQSDLKNKFSGNCLAKLTSRVDGQLPNRLMMAQNIKVFTACTYILLEKNRVHEEKM